MKSNFRTIGMSSMLIAGFLLVGAPAMAGDTLRMGESMNPNTQYGSSKIVSKNGAYKAIMQSDCNFVIYRNSNNKALWSSNTYKKGTLCYLVIQRHDGNLVLYDGHRKALWATNRHEKSPGVRRLVMQDDGNLVLYKDGAKYAVWASNTVQKAAPKSQSPKSSSSGNSHARGRISNGYYHNSLGIGRGIGHRAVSVLKTGQYLEENSTKGYYKAIMQKDCNFVVYDPQDKALWATHTNGKGENCQLSFKRENGVSLKIHDGGGREIWSLNRQVGKHSSLSFQLRNDGLLRILESGSTSGHVKPPRVVWKSSKPAPVAPAPAPARRRPLKIENPSQNQIKDYTVAIDCLVSGADDEETGNRVTVAWYVGSGHTIGEKYIDGIDTCHGSNDKWTLRSEIPPDYVIISINGDDGYLMDQIEMYVGDKRVKVYGNNDSRGWCLSTDNGDHNRGNFKGHSVDSQCPHLRRFDY